MSIDALIRAHIEALNTNTEAVKLLTLSLAGRTPKAEEKSKTSKAEVVAAIKENLLGKEEPNPEVIIHQDENGDEVIEDGQARPPLAYETVRALVLKLAGAGKREEIKSLNAKHGIANLKVLLDKEDDFSTVNDQAKLEAVYADLQALEA